MLTVKQIEDYVSQKGLRCPYCGSVGHIEAGPAIPDVEKTQINQSMQCRSCKQEWLDVYNLTTICDEEVTPTGCGKVDCDCAPKPE